MKKLIAVFNVLTVAMMAGTYVLYYFSLRKLGMVRFLNFHSQNIKSAIPLDVVKYIVLAVAAILVVIVGVAALLQTLTLALVHSRLGR